MRASAEGTKIYAGRAIRRLWAAFATVGLLLSAPASSAHPMGNFSISHYAGIRIEADFIELHYLIDMAEIPTFQEMQQSGIVAERDDPRVIAFVASEAVVFAQGLQVTLDGHALPLEVVSEDILFPPGAGNLPTMKFGFVYRAATRDACESARCELAFRDTNFPGRAGWKEIVASAGPGVLLASSTASARDRSLQLTNYPTDLLNSPPQALDARVVFSRQERSTPSAALSTKNSKPERAPLSRNVTSGSAAGDHASVIIAPTPQLGGTISAESLKLEANRQTTPRNRFTELMRTQQLGLGIVLLAALIAAGLGALHALEPGHGKTIVAAYLVGAKGTARHAFLLGMIVTISHTAGVYFLGGITLYAQKYILPDKLYPFLGVLSGILIAGMGFYLFLQRYVGGEFAHAHHHGPGGHDHHAGLQRPHASSGEHGQEGISEAAETPPQPDRSVSARQLLVLGITGGIIPCPAALVVLLSAVALDRVGFGLFLIVAFSVGLAAVLILMGLLAVYAGRVMSRLPMEGALIERWLPLTSAAMITVLGCVIAVRGLIGAGILQIQV
jgi:nickel/cobalt transporter (NicO) family protein